MINFGRGQGGLAAWLRLRIVGGSGNTVHVSRRHWHWPPATFVCIYVHAGSPEVRPQWLWLIARWCQVNMEAWRSFRGQACCKQHARTTPRPRRCGTKPTQLIVEDPPLLRCPPVTTRDATVHPVGNHPRQSYLIFAL
jgi:hypothetical protein